jgi:hypothetical protein
VTAHAQRTLPNGAREIAGFFDEQRGLFGVTHLPVGAPSLGVVVCPPLHAEMGKNYRREVLLARRLAAAGIAVQRFAYGGTGHSIGDEHDLVLEQLVDDTESARRHLVGSADLDHCAFVGTRLGALVAARFAGPDAHLTLWDPVVDVRQHFRFVLRAAIIRGLKDGHTKEGASHFSLDKLDAVGTLDVLGYPITWRLYESMRGRTVQSELRRGPTRVHVVEFGTAPQPGVARLLTALEGPGHEVEHDVLDVEPAWWFGRGGHVDVATRAEQVSALIDRSCQQLLAAPVRTASDR